MPTGYTMVDAGILSEDAQSLTPGAKKKFINDVKEILTLGSLASSASKLFPCGPKIDANPFSAGLDIEDEKKFPDFHKNILGLYRDIAIKMNVKSNFSLLPICCPISFALKLGIDIDIPKFPDGFIQFMFPNLPALALKLNIMPPPKLALKFPSLLGLPPKLPDFQLQLPKIPDFKALYDFKLSFVLNMPKFMLSLIAKIPEFALKLPNLPKLFSLICDLAFKANLFGNIGSDALILLAVVKVLTRKIVEMSFIDAVGITLGSSPGGITGGLGQFLGYQPPPQSSSVSSSPRAKIVDYAMTCDSMSISNASAKKDDDYVRRIYSIESQDPKASGSPDSRALGYDATKAKFAAKSSSGAFVKACLMAGGAACTLSHGDDSSLRVNTAASDVVLYHNFFQDSYNVTSGHGDAIAGIITAAIIKDAFISERNKRITGDLPKLKAGDVIVVKHPTKPGKEHAMIVTSDYSGGFELKTIEGGQIDKDNGNRPTAVRKKTYVNANKVTADQTSSQGAAPYVMYVENGTNDVVIGGRKVLCIIDGEKICTNDKGSSLSTIAGKIDRTLASDENDDSNDEQFMPRQAV